MVRERKMRVPAGSCLIVFVLAVLATAQPARAQDPMKPYFDKFNAFYEAGKYREAEEVARQALAVAERSFQHQPSMIAVCLNNLAMAYNELGRYADAEKHYNRSRVILERVEGAQSERVGQSYNNLANVYLSLGRLADAEAAHKRSLAINEKLFGPNDPRVAQSLVGLAGVYQVQGRFADAEPLYRRMIPIFTKLLGPDNPVMAGCLTNLASLHVEQARYGEAEAEYHRAQAILEKAKGPNHPEVADVLNNLALMEKFQGRYAEAEGLLRRALAINEKTFGAVHKNVAMCLSNLAAVLGSQYRYNDAEPLLKRAVAIWEQALGKEHGDTAKGIATLADVTDALGRHAEAEALYRKVVAIDQKALGAEHPATLLGWHVLATFLVNNDRLDEAGPILDRIQPALEKALGPEHPHAASNLREKAYLLYKQERYADAVPLLDRVAAMEAKAGFEPKERVKAVTLAAVTNWKLGKKDAALTDIQSAMDLAEQSRGHLSGSAQDRAELFGALSSPFEAMVEWQAELGDMSAAFSALERSRARTLLEQLDLAGVDLLAGLPRDQAGALRTRDREAKTRVNAIQKQLDLLAELPGLSADAKRDKGNALRATLAEAQQAVVQVDRDIRDASPASRLALSKDRKPARLDDLKRWIAKSESLLIEYLVSEDQCYALIVAGGDAKPRLEKLTLSEESARTLESQTGPLTEARLQAIVPAILKRISSPGSAPDTSSQLAALWTVLVPEPERQALVGGHVKRLLVVPDGPIALLPLEVLVVAQDDDTPKYLLDVGPPIVYGPSATVLFNLSERPASPARKADREPVLAVGDPAYPGTEPAAGGSSDRARYATSGGRLSRLPYTSWEAQWVVKAFSENGIKAALFSGKTATEAAVRYWAPGRRILHLACHGLADQAYGNLFGALALTPGPQAATNPADDGFLTLAEIDTMDLKSCELAILSACKTNFGPQQKGEGTWALSRGFLVAGARRVVASDWLVDDEAGANLVSVFCARLAKAEKEAREPDYTRALQAAKRWVRQQEKWQSPYYWGAMVLVGAP